jgi:hypothetical protein
MMFLVSMLHQVLQHMAQGTAQHLVQAELTLSVYAPHVWPAAADSVTLRLVPRRKKKVWQRPVAMHTCKLVPKLLPDAEWQKD